MKSRMSADVAEWVGQVKEAQEAIFKASAQELVKELSRQLTVMVYSEPSTDQQRTGFLRASLVASKSAMPVLNRDNPGVAVQENNNEVILTISGAQLDDTIYLGYTASYGAYVHYGTSNSQGRPWVDLVAQRWPQIVEEQATRTIQAFGL